MPPVDFAPAAAGSGTTQPAEGEPRPRHDVALAPQEELALQAPSEAEPRDDGPASAAGLEDVAPAAAPPESRHSKVRRDAPLPSSRTLLLPRSSPDLSALKLRQSKLRPVNRKSIALQRRRAGRRPQQ